MTSKNQKNRQQSSGSNVGIGVGVAAAAVAAAAAGAYFLYGSKDAAKNRKKVSGWMLKAKGEVLEKLETMKDTLTEESYNKVIDGVVAKYSSMKGGSSAEAEALGNELKSHWKNIKKHFTTVKPVKTTPLTAQKKTTKKSAKKTTNK